MKQIRNNVFETNSSSTHSITISGLKDKYDVPNHTLIVEFGEYGWEQECYVGVESKLSYVYTLMQYHIEGIKWDEKDINVVLKSKWSIWIQEMIMDYCNQEVELPVLNDQYHVFGYVDHQSSDILDDFWLDDEQKFKESMKEFVFNNKYGFTTDNDNH